MIQEKIKITPLKVNRDERGMLSKIFDYAALEGKNIKDICLTYTIPRENRANPYPKKTKEWFCAIKGEGVLKFKDISTNEEFDANLDGNDLKLIEVPPGIVHQVFAKGKEELILIAFGNQPYKKDDTDTRTD